MEAADSVDGVNLPNQFESSWWLTVAITFCSPIWGADWIATRGKCETTAATTQECQCQITGALKIRGWMPYQGMVDDHQILIPRYSEVDGLPIVLAGRGINCPFVAVVSGISTAMRRVGFERVEVLW